MMARDKRIEAGTSTLKATESRVGAKLFSPWLEGVNRMVT
jgi:hypothetical protein